MNSIITFNYCNDFVSPCVCVIFSNKDFRGVFFVYQLYIILFQNNIKKTPTMMEEVNDVNKQIRENDQKMYELNNYDYEEDNVDNNDHIEEEIQLRSNKYRRYNSICMLLGMVICYNLSSFYIGYALVYFNAVPYIPIHQIYKIKLDRGVGEGLFSGLIQFGAVFGAFSMRYVLKYFSRRQAYLLANTIAILAGVMIVIPEMKLLLIGRFIQGSCVGLYSTLTPLVVKQLIPVEVSGTFGSFYMTSIILGTLTAYTLPTILMANYQLQDFYQYTFGITLGTIILQTLLLLFVYKNQTPKYLILKQRLAQAKQLIQKIYKQQYWDIVYEQKMTGFRKIFNPQKHNKSSSQHTDKKQKQQKVEHQQNQKQQKKNQEMKIQQKLTQDQKKQNYKANSGQTLNKNKSMSSDHENQVLDDYDIKYLKEIPVARGFAFQMEVFQMFTGVYVIALYGRQIAKNSVPQIQQALPIFLNALRLIASIAGVFIISKFGRKKPMLIGTFIICISLIGFCIGFTGQEPSGDIANEKFTFLKFLVLFSFIVFTVSYSCTLGPITYLYIPEIVQPPTIPFTTMVSWLCAYLMVFLFPIVRQEQSGYKDIGGKDGIGLFIFFAICTAVHLVITWRIMVETKYRDEQQIRILYENLRPCKCIKNGEPKQQPQIQKQAHKDEIKADKF